MRRWLLAAAGLVVVALGVLVVVALRGGGARQASMDEARKRFHASTSTQPSPPVLLRPAAGVYEYEGRGREHLDKPPKSQSQGPVVPATLTHGADGCWEFRVDYSTGHWQSWDYCSRDGTLVERGGMTYTKWDFVVFEVDNTSTFRCESVVIRRDMAPGDRWDQRCSGTNTAVEGTTEISGSFTLVGVEDLAIGGTKVPAYRFRQDHTIAGAQDGTSQNELWFATRDGMPLKNIRRHVVKSDSPIGKVTYTETGEFTLRSLEPRT